MILKTCYLLLALELWGDVMFNEDNITIFNSYFDTETRLTKYKRTYLYGVDWQDTKAISINQVRGLMNDDEALIFIPYNVDSERKKYIKPKAYQKLSDVDKDNYYTFKENDKIVKGIIDFKITDEKNRSIKYLETYYDDVVDVKKIASCDMMMHFEIGCE